MFIAKKLESLFTRFLPSPFTIAIILTFLTLILALLCTENKSEDPHILNLLSYWENGMWNNNMIVFAFQMMLIMILGHVLALSNFASNQINKITKYCNNTANSAAIVTF